MTEQTEELLFQAYGHVTLGVCSHHGHWRIYHQTTEPRVGCPHCVQVAQDLQSIKASYLFKAPEPIKG